MSVVALVFVFGACEKFRDILLPNNTDNGCGKPKLAPVSFSKMKLVNGNEVFAAVNEFAFNLYKDIDGEWVLQGTYPTNANGSITVNDLEPGSYVFKEKASNNWKLEKGIEEIEFTVDAGTVFWSNDFMWDKEEIVNIQTAVMSDLSWNNGNTSGKDGANGAGLNQFSVNGTTFKNNKNYVTPAHFDAALNKAFDAKKDNPDIYTVTERATSQLGDKKADKYTAPITGKYTKIYYVQVAMYKNAAWIVYEGTITVDNPGGNDNKQKMDLIRVQ